MDYTGIINACRAQVEAIDRAIAQLESLVFRNGALLPQARRQGRKYMAPKERREVSERMKRYWAARRKGKRQG